MRVLATAVLLIAVSADAVAVTEACDRVLRAPTRREQLVFAAKERVGRFVQWMGRLLSQQAQQGPDKSNAAERQSSYQAHNTNSDTPPTPNDQIEVVAQAVGLRNVVYFGQTKYQSVNPLTGEVNLRPIQRRQDLINVQPTGFLKFPLNSKYQLIRGGAPLIPSGYQVVQSADFGVDVSGNFYFKNATAGEVKVGIAESMPRRLNEAEQRAYLSLEQRLGWEDIPESLQDFVASLNQQRRALRMTDLQVAQKLVDHIRVQYKYRVNADGNKGVRAWLSSGAFQCDGAAVIAVALLRQFFGIRSAPVVGYQGSSDQQHPDDSVVVLPSIGHMWIEVYEPSVMNWFALDPTPQAPDELRKNDNQSNQDSRFRPNSNEASSDTQTQDNSSDATQGSSGGESSSQAEAGTEVESSAQVQSLQQLFDELLASAATPKDLSDGLFVLKNHPEISQNPHLGEKINTLVEAIAPHSQSGWKSMISTLLASHKPEIEDVVLMQKLQKVHQLMVTLGQSQNPNSAAFRQVAQLLSQILPRPEFGMSDELKTAQKIAKSLGDRPLDFQWLSSNYPNFTTDPLSASKLLVDLKEGRLIPFLIRSFVGRYLELGLVLSPKQIREYQQWGQPQPYGQGDLVLRPVAEIDRPELIYRDGTPSHLDYFRAMSGDLYEVHHHTDAHIDAFQSSAEQFRTLTIVLTDLSGSNDDHNRGLIRDALVLRYMDMMAAQFDSGQTGSWLIEIPYRAQPIAEFKYTSRVELEDGFYKWAANGRNNNNANNTARAIQRALQLAREHADQFHRVNLILLTDGEETINLNLIREEQAAIPAQLEINLAAVTFVTGNEAIRTLSDQFYSNLRVQFQQPRLQHIPLGEVERIIQMASSHNGIQSYLVAQRYDWSRWRQGVQVKARLQEIAERL